MDKIISNNSLAGQQSQQTSAYDVNSQFDRNAVSLSKIKNFSFSAGTGGTIVLGGANNGNGLLRVRNSTGGTVVTLNNNGLTVTNGSITILNSSGGTVIDPSGLVSSTSFPNGAIFNGSASLTTTSTSLVDVTGGLFGTVTLSRAGNLLMYMMAYGYNSDFIESDSAHYMQMTVFDSFLGTSILDVILTAATSTNVTFPGPGTTQSAQATTDQMVSRTTIIGMSAGTHVLKLQYKAVTGGTAHLDSFDLGVVALGI